MKPKHSLKHYSLFSVIVLAGAVAFASSAHAALITLNASDTTNTNVSFNTAGQWSNTAAPSAGNTYQINVAGRYMRTPYTTGDFTFAGDSLTLSAGSIMGTKSTSNTAVITVNNLITNNGILRNMRDGTGSSVRATFAGNIDNQAGGLRLEANSGPITLQSTLSGVGNVTLVSGNTGFLSRFTGVNTYSGNTTIGSTAAGSNATYLEFTSTNQQLFNIQNSNVSNFILGAGTAVALFNGDFNVSTLSLTDTTGLWNLVNVGTLTETWGATFGLKLNDTIDFTNEGSGIYTANYGTQGWSFDTSTGSLALAVIPEPRAALLCSLGMLLLLRRRRAA